LGIEAHRDYYQPLTTIDPATNLYDDCNLDSIMACAFDQMTTDWDAIKLIPQPNHPRLRQEVFR
jgi:hypothetical protein